eukprot:Hpha_TRINITY_DN5194_c0_g1::TRINITY_DN5194_c0_g1_i1::g.193116::m.193116
MASAAALLGIVSLSAVRLEYTYWYTRQPVRWAGHYDDPHNRVLNDGSSPGEITPSNGVAWAAAYDDWEPVLALRGGLAEVTSVRLSYIVKRGWSKFRPAGATLHGGRTDNAWVEVVHSEGSWEGEHDGGHSKTISVEGWGCVRYIRLSELLPSAQQSVLTEVEVFGQLCQPSPDASSLRYAVRGPPLLHPAPAGQESGVTRVQRTGGGAERIMGNLNRSHEQKPR